MIWVDGSPVMARHPLSYRLGTSPTPVGARRCPANLTPGPPEHVVLGRPGEDAGGGEGRAGEGTQLRAPTQEVDAPASPQLHRVSNEPGGAAALPEVPTWVTRSDRCLDRACVRSYVRLLRSFDLTTKSSGP